jgi:hypothetical protein
MQTHAHRSASFALTLLVAACGGVVTPDSPSDGSASNGLTQGDATATCDPGKDDPAPPGKDDPAPPGKDDPAPPGKDDPAPPGKDDPGHGSSCLETNLPGDLCKDASALKEWALAICKGIGDPVVASPTDDVCDPKATIRCCPPAPAPAPACKELPIPSDICADASAVKDLALATCEAAGLTTGISSPTGDMCDPKATIDCCEPDPNPMPLPDK